MDAYGRGTIAEREMNTTSRPLRSLPAAVGALLLVLALLLPARPAQGAANFLVNYNIDEVDEAPGDGRCKSRPTGLCTLRAAIMEANALPGPDTITLAGTFHLELGGRGEDNAVTGDLDIRGDLTFVEQIPGRSRIKIDARGVDRVFDVHSGTVTMRNMTITGGDARLVDARLPDQPNGGGIRNLGGELTLDGVVIVNNAVQLQGGGVQNLGESAKLRVQNSTLTRNSARMGGGIQNDLGGRIDVINSTISGNEAEGGGAIDNAGVTSLRNVTINENRSRGPGLSNSGRPGTELRLANTILADNGDFNCDGRTPAISLGGNIDFSRGGVTCGVAPPFDIGRVDPLLAGLADNGGPTPTHALLEGSPAIDSPATRDCPTSDQRGEGRPLDGDGDGVELCDSGAYEFKRRSGDGGEDREAFDRLIESVAGLEQLGSSQREDLLRPLERGAEQFDRDNRKAACSQLDAFEKEVRQQAEKRELDPKAADDLLGRAEQVAAILKCDT